MTKNTAVTPADKSTYHSGSLWDIKANCSINSDLRPLLCCVHKLLPLSLKSLIICKQLIKMGIEEKRHRTTGRAAMH